MTGEQGRAAPTTRVVHASEVPAVPLGDAGTQRVLLGAPHADGSPLLMGISQVLPGRTSALIEHASAEIAYVLSGTGWMVTDTSEHPFGPGDAILIEEGCWHAIRAGEEPVEMVYVFPGSAVPATRAHPGAVQ
ncbi:cupin domain-containing protein [Sphaerisporangium viridialbum]|uniref:cupin domain-containing protein n=1 Tax=Sphaerisporangium viridialbum TaxID=46189 RepID=UPI003C767266